MSILRFVWRACRSHPLAPWRSPYLRWRVETYSGIPAKDVNFRVVTHLLWHERHQVLRYLRWLREMDEAAQG